MHEDHLISAGECAHQRRAVLVVRHAQGDSNGRRLLAAWTSRTIAITSWPSDANLKTTARPTWPVAPVTRIIVPLHVPARLTHISAVICQSIASRVIRLMSVL